jgi:hypothetical protein
MGVNRALLWSGLERFGAAAHFLAATLRALILRIDIVIEY